MATITKADMVEYLHNELGLNKSECKILIEDFFDEIKDALISGEEVKLSGFGNFELLNKNERPGRNPKMNGLKLILTGLKQIEKKNQEKVIMYPTK